MTKDIEKNPKRKARANEKSKSKKTQGIKSRERVRDAGEVFTQPREVKAMCDLCEPTISEIDIERAKEDAKQDIRNEMVNVAISASEEILKREVDNADNKRLAEEFIDQLN